MAEPRADTDTFARAAQSQRAMSMDGAPAAVEQLRSAREKASVNEATPAVPPQSPGPLADQAVTSSPAGSLRRQIAEDRRLPPAQWMQAIRRHRFEGNSALARASLQAFQRAHPDQAVPEDLRTLLP